MSKQITRIVLTGGPAAGKTTLISRILKEFKQEDGWRVITIPETATMLIAGYGIGPFENCMSMYDFQYYVTEDQLHKERLALKAAEAVPQDKILIVYDRAIFDNRAYMSDEEFRQVLAAFNTTPEEMTKHYDAVLHLVTCAKGAEFAYNFGSEGGGANNNSRYEDLDTAREVDDRTLEAWSTHPNLHVIDNAVNFEDKIARGIAKVYEILGLRPPEKDKKKYLIEKPSQELLSVLGEPIDMTQIYLANTIPNVERRIREQPGGHGSLYFYTEKRADEQGNRWVIERPVSLKEYEEYRREADPSLAPVSKKKYRFNQSGTRMEIDVYPYMTDYAILFIYGDAPVPEGIRVIQDVTGDPEYKNRRLARKQNL